MPGLPASPVTLRPTNGNIRGFLSCALVAGVAGGRAVTASSGMVWIFSAVAVVELVLAIRFAGLRVTVRPDTVTVHGLFRTRRLSWAEIVRIEAPSGRLPVTLVTISGERIRCAGGSPQKALAVLQGAWRATVPAAVAGL